MHGNTATSVNITGEREVSVRTLTEYRWYDRDDVDVRWRVESGSVINTWDRSSGRKSILGYAEFPKGLALPTTFGSFLEFIDMVEEKSLYVHWKVDSLIPLLRALHEAEAPEEDEE